MKMAIILAAICGSVALLSGCSQPDESPEERRARYCQDYASGGSNSGREWLNSAVLQYTTGPRASEISPEVRALLVRMLPAISPIPGVDREFDCNDEEFRPIFDLYVEFRARTDEQAQRTSRPYLGW
ncbi:hypothetical protein GS921_24895 [Rhodococcus hoagii]|nr:hypothetical protein [Prescottella equi]